MHLSSIQNDIQQIFLKAYYVLVALKPASSYPLLLYKKTSEKQLILIYCNRKLGIITKISKSSIVVLHII